MRKIIKSSLHGGESTRKTRKSREHLSPTLPPLNTSCNFQIKCVFGSFYTKKKIYIYINFTHSSKFSLQAFCVAWSTELFLIFLSFLRARQSQVTLSSNSHFGKEGGGGEETEDFIAIITNQNTSECLNLLLRLFSSSTICQAERKQLNFFTSLVAF